MEQSKIKKAIIDNINQEGDQRGIYLPDVYASISEEISRKMREEVTNFVNTLVEQGHFKYEGAGSYLLIKEYN